MSTHASTHATFGHDHAREHARRRTRYAESAETRGTRARTHRERRPDSHARTQTPLFKEGLRVRGRHARITKGTTMRPILGYPLPELAIAAGVPLDQAERLVQAELSAGLLARIEWRGQVLYARITTEVQG